MGSARGHAPGKIILFGEHAVVYGRPALAVPLGDLRAIATAEPSDFGEGVVIEASDLDRRFAMRAAPDEPLAVTARLTLEHLKVKSEPDVTLRVTSDIPVASGLGSGAAVSTALARALAAHLGKSLPPEALSPLIFEVEKLHHGTPSGIDNTVVVYGQPVYFKRNEPAPPLIEMFHAGAPIHLLIADTGIASPTKVTVGDVREGWQAQPAAYELTFDQIGGLVDRTRQAIEEGDTATLGPLMNQNQELLRKLDVSSPEIEVLVAAALDAGGQGVKLSGGGRGGNVIALVDPTSRPYVTTALKDAGATNVLATTLRPSPSKFV
jgi:mevalonate kinase